MSGTEAAPELFGVYIHWPFCAAKCPYCDFNSHVREAIDHEAWRTSFLREIEYYAALTPDRKVTSIFFGGGTPSLMAPDTVSAVIDQVQKRWHISNDCEITLEANPTSIEADKFAAFRLAGVNRVSVGVQALNDADLQFLGRQHNAAEAKKALDIANQNFDRVSYDLIYARPEQTPEAWAQELQQALELSRGHLSLYQLTIEKGTPFFTQHERGEFKVPEDDLAGALYEMTQEIMAAHDMPAYEVSNHAMAGLESRHNLAYWRYEDYVGVGPGAHGRLTLDSKKNATRAHRAPEIWMDRVNKDGCGSHPFEVIEAEQRFTESLMMGLRIAEGVAVDKLSREAGGDWKKFVDQNRLGILIDEGMLELSNDVLKATSAGLQRLNAVAAYLL